MYPELNELRRVRVDVSRKETQVVVVSWLLPDYKKDNIINSGRIPGLFTHRYSLRKKDDDCPNEFKVISKRWRQQQGSRHKDIESFAHTVFGDTKYDLMQVMTTIKNYTHPR